MFQRLVTLEVGCITVARRTEVRLVVMLLDAEVWILCVHRPDDVYPRFNLEL